ncbi:M23 family metallopeptidase [Amniculibacterium sp. G2-70]|uniref:M23 family metallopeptidase n=1 Tax=Amniculibacterium sp. G2-70 TaxID=2767188 RepID=UPI00165455C5|nr:M23 family metallopeptidase [Amniculibacterium sp. G2-70]
MKKYYQKILILGTFLFAFFVFGQFNTLKPIVSKNESKISLSTVNEEKIKINKNENSKENSKKEKKFLKKIFGITPKNEIKKDMDSLKNLLKEYTDFNNEKWNLQNSKDSLLLNTQAKLLQNRTNQSSLPKYEFISEPSEFFSKIVMPLKGDLFVTSPYGCRTHPIFGTKKMHNGIDLRAHYENVFSIMDGIVTASGWDTKGGGNYIKINHFGRFETAYLHLSEIYYKVGERVKAGFIIAKSGNTGNSTGPHLHFSVREFGQLINPTHFLNDLIKANNLIATHYAK